MAESRVVPGTTAATRLLCVLGHPVAHSRSPELHSAAIAATGVDAVYLAFDVAPEAFAAAIAGLRALRGWLGANVTIPHKAAALALADAATEEAAFVGAANTLFWDEEGRLVADNTDAVGLQQVLADDIGVAPGDRAVIVGSGGAARAAAVALGRLGAAVAVDARRPEAGAEVAELAVRAGGAAGADEGPPRLVVNATPLGRHGERLPERWMGLGAGQVALDLNVDPEPSPFLRAAAAGGARAVDGRGMLVAQAVAAFARWTGRRVPPERVAPVVAG